MTETAPSAISPSLLLLERKLTGTELKVAPQPQARVRAQLIFVGAMVVVGIGWAAKSTVRDWLGTDKPAITSTAGNLDLDDTAATETVPMARKAGGAAAPVPTLAAASALQATPQQPSAAPQVASNATAIEAPAAASAPIPRSPRKPLHRPVISDVNEVICFAGCRLGTGQVVYRAPAAPIVPQRKEPDYLALASLNAPRSPGTPLAGFLNRAVCFAGCYRETTRLVALNTRTRDETTENTAVLPELQLQRPAAKQKRSLLDRHRARPRGRIVSKKPATSHPADIDSVTSTML